MTRRAFKRFLYVLLSCVFIINMLPLNTRAEEQNKPEIAYVDVLWKETYTSFEDLIKGSDIVVTGFVKDQYTVKLYDLVYTISELEVSTVLQGEEDNNDILVSQLGGVYGDYYFPSPEDTITLKREVEYALFLNGNDGEYVIAGACQGVFILDGTDGDIFEICEKEFTSQAYIPMVVDTPVTGYTFPAGYSSVGYSISVKSGINMSSENLSNFKAGVESWNGLSGISVYNTIESAAQIKISIVNNSDDVPVSPGSTLGNDTLAVTYGELTTYNRFIYVFYDSISYSWYWQRLGCHETGHALGLGHNTASPSCMKPTISAMTLYPQEADVNTLRVVYGYPY